MAQDRAALASSSVEIARRRCPARFADGVSVRVAAALWSLANGAKLVDEYPAMAKLRLVQALPHGSGSAGRPVSRAR